MGWLRSATLWRTAGAVLLFSCLVLFTVPAEPSVRLCGFQWLTGHPCPLCGMTRGIFALAKGHLAEAIRFNALSPLGFLMLFALFWKKPVPARFWTLTAVLLGTYGLVRLLAA